MLAVRNFPFHILRLQLPSRSTSHAIVLTLMIGFLVAMTQAKGLSDNPELNSSIAKVEKAYGEANRAFGRKDFPKAVGRYSDAIRLDANFTPAYVGRGNAYLAQMQYDQAAADYDRALSINPGYSVAYFARGTLRWFLGDLGRAEDDYRKAVEYDAENNYYYSRLATVLYEQKKDSEVYALYDRAYRSDPRREWALWGWLGGVAAKKDYEDLLRTCETLTSNGNHAVPVRFYMGIAYLRLKRFTEASRELEAAIAVDPNTIGLNTFLFLAEAYKGANKPSECKSAVQQYWEREGRTAEAKALQWCEERNSP